MKPAFLTLDTLDDRRELWHLLHQLAPALRVTFLDRQCGRVANPQTGNGPRPIQMGKLVREATRCGRGDERLTNAVYADLLALSSQWDLDLVAAAVELEQWVRRRRVFRPISGVRKP